MSCVSEILQAHGPSSSKVLVQTFLAEEDEDRDDVPPMSYVLIEGDQKALKFLADLILAFVDSDYGCNLDIHPTGAGSNHMSDASTHGIYLHKLPCEMTGAPPFSTWRADPIQPLKLRIKKEETHG
jgi:hypothetical protein